jgi:mono/diheme cytochrome c family protein
MAPVADNLAIVPEPEVRAIAVYIAARMATSARTRTAAAGTAISGRGASGAEPSDHSEDAPVDATQAQDGEAIYRSTCAGCHDGGRRGIALDYSTSVTDRTPANLIRITLDGIHPREGEKGALMPAFRGALGDSQLASLVAFLRTRFGHAQPWQDIGGEIAKAKRKDAGEEGKPS